MKLSFVIDELVEERGLERGVLAQVISEGMLAAYNKKYPNLNLFVNYNKKSDEIEVTIQKTVVNAVSDEDAEISLRKSKAIDPELKVGDIVTLPFEKPIGRIEILKAKQVIAQKIRFIESMAVFEAFKSKEGTIVQGVIHKCERNGVLVKMQDTLAFLPTSLSIPGERCVVGYPIRALLKEVLPEPRNENQLILDRVSPSFLQKLFEIEIPEIYENLVEIKKVVRAPGYKSKILVASNDQNIDPVGTCVGVGGARIKPVLREIGAEKIDIISYKDNLEDLVRDSLKPAEVNRVELVDSRRAMVWVDDEQRSVAIGRHGQNIALASALSGVEIDLVKGASSGHVVQDEEENDNLID